MTFSAIHSAFMSGMYVFISRGASVLGVFWKIIRTPSTSNSSIASETMAVRGNQTGRTRRYALAQTLADIAIGACRQQQAILVEQPPVHGIAGIDVLGNGEVHEIDRRDQRDLAGAHIGFVDKTADAAPVIAMGMRVNYGGDRQALADMLLKQFPGGAHRLGADERIEHDPSGLAAHDT